MLMYVCLCMYLCIMYVCTYVHVCIPTTPLPAGLSLCVCMYVCVCMYTDYATACRFVHVCICMSNILNLDYLYNLCAAACRFVHVYVRMYVCICMHTDYADACRFGPCMYVCIYFMYYALVFVCAYDLKWRATLHFWRDTMTSYIHTYTHTYTGRAQHTMISSGGLLYIFGGAQ
jgi:hypothetical protein